MAQTLLQQRFADAGVEISTGSAGTLPGGHPLAEGALRVLARHHGADLSAYSSRQLSAPMIEDTPLVLCMERAHVREIAVLVPSAWPRVFTMKEFVRRGEHVGARRSDEPAEDWIAAVHHGRGLGDLLGSDDADDVVDPMGGSASDFERTAAELDDLCRRAVDLLVAPLVTSGPTGSSGRIE
jgi:protein-tyrosine phosphatase